MRVRSRRLSRRTTAVVVATTLAAAAGAVTTATAFISTQATGRTEAVVAQPGQVTTDDVTAPMPALGLHPGAAPARITLHLDNPQDLTYTVTGITPDAARFPQQCPAHAWRVTVPEPVVELAPRSGADVTVALTLTEDAPASCQGLHASLPLTLVGRYS